MVTRYIVQSIFLCLYWLSAFAQVGFKTSVPRRPIIIGESFQVQYIIENATDVAGFAPPSFAGFRVVSGPNVYEAEKSAARRNLVFTLAAIKEGKFKVRGATCLLNGKLTRSNDVLVRVVPRSLSDESCYFLGPGEDPWQKIRENIFLKLVVDKTSCFIGEPLVATFKLYSRLQSKSDVVKNPGFYGFGVYDIINVADKVKSEEQRGGHWFDVHTIRKVQLYPLQAGIFTIDAMELSNKIEFSRSVVYKTTEQEISENMYNRPSPQPNSNAYVYEMSLKSDPVTIRVKPLPAKNATDTFAGAVGNFSINAFVEKDTILRNEQDALIIDISGAGNFQKISSPILNWPQHVENFEPFEDDTLDKRRVPLTGQKRFKYVFLSNTSGRYIIPSVSFSFFNLNTKKYKTVSTKPLTIFVATESKPQNTSTVQSAVVNTNRKMALWVVIISMLFLTVAAFLWIGRARWKRKTNLKQVANSSEPLLVISIEELFRPAEIALDNNDRAFFKNLNTAAWSYFGQRFQFSGSQLNKFDLANSLASKGIVSGKVNELINLIHQSEIGMYTDADVDLDRRRLFESVKGIILEIESGFC